jgi:hypothetical protein
MQRLYQNSFNVGNIVGDDEKNNKLLVVSQNPASDNSTYPLGYRVNFRLSSGGKQEINNDLDSLLWNSMMTGEDTTDNEPFEEVEDFLND